MLVYLGGPIDSARNLDDEIEWRSDVRVRLRERGITTFDPLVAWGGYCSDRKVAESIAAMDLKVIKECDLLLARYSLASFGTSVEVGVAVSINIPIILWGKDLEEATSAVLEHRLISKVASSLDAVDLALSLLESRISLSISNSENKLH